MFVHRIAIIAALSLSACVSTDPISGSSVDKTYSLGGFSWNTGRQVYVAYKTFKSGNHVGICGAYGGKGAGGANSSDLDMIRAGSVFLGGTRVVQGVEFMHNAVHSSKIKGGTANCVRSSVEWRPEFAKVDSVLRFPSMSFR